MDIQDFGEKIGGAKKDLWKERGLSLDDLNGMNIEERAKFITKDNIWKKPNYQELVNNGMSTRMAYFIKIIRDATPTKPSFYSLDNINEKQETYISFISELRDFVMNMKEDSEILTFHTDFIKKYVVQRTYGLAEVIPEYEGCVTNKLYKAAQIHNLTEIDRGISKHQFLYTDDEKILSEFDIILYDNNNVKFEKDYSNRNIISVKIGYGKRYIYPKAEFDSPQNWKENTIFIYKQGKIITNNLASIEDAEKYILENFKTEKKKRTGNHKTAFKPKQLENVIRTGEDYRDNKNITGEDMLQKFNFKGGEFGNWLNENDRQQSLNYGYDALLDLSKALNISPTDISLGNRLSIAFGSRGSGNALAHYEPLREVINLTKMKGAGSLAHEWAHALDDIIGKKEGYNGFLTEKSNSKVVLELIDAMKYKTICNDKSKKIQIDRYEKRVNQLKNIINSCFPSEYLNEETTKQKDKLLENLIDNSEVTANDYISYYSGKKINKDLEELSNLRKSLVGKIISKTDKSNIFYLQNQIANSKNEIGQPQKIETDFYKNSKSFDDIHSKTSHGYWQSTIEMFARCFACYVKDKLNNRSDYLCGHAHSDITINNNDEVIKAFPEGEERTIINEKIDNLIEILKHKALLHDSRTQEISNEVEYDY